MSSPDTTLRSKRPRRWSSSYESSAYESSAYESSMDVSSVAASEEEVDQEMDSESSVRLSVSSSLQAGMWSDPNRNLRSL